MHIVLLRKNAFSYPLGSGSSSGDAAAGRRDAGAGVIQHLPGSVPASAGGSWNTAGVAASLGGCCWRGGCWQPRWGGGDAGLWLWLMKKGVGSPQQQELTLNILGTVGGSIVWSNC